MAAKWKREHIKNFCFPTKKQAFLVLWRLCLPPKVHKQTQWNSKWILIEVYMVSGTILEPKMEPKAKTKFGHKFESILTSIASGFGSVFGSHASDADRRRPALFGRRKCPPLQPHTFLGGNGRFSSGSAQIRDFAVSGFRNKLRL